jgi:hypothetical protein
VNEAGKSSGTIYCHFQPDYLHGIQSLYNLLSALREGLVVKHIVRFHPPNAPKGPLLNTQCFNALLQLLYVASIKDADSYCPNYYYDDRVSPNFRIMEMFPNVVVGGQRVLLFSAERGKGLLLTGKDISDFFLEEFVRLYKNCEPLAKIYNNVFELNSYFMGWETPESPPLITMKNDPCFVLFLTPEALWSCVKADFPNTEIFIDTICGRLDYWCSRTEKIIFFNTVKGIKDLMENGIISDAPSEIANPLLPTYRKVFLQKMIDYAQSTPSFQLYVFRPEILYDMTWRAFYIYGQTNLMIKLYDTRNFVEITEKGIVNIFNYYFKYMVTHPNHFLSREELIEYLQSLLEKYFPE